ncbi:GDSL-type esterase/lipase family protein [Luteolibacter arcticus]|uniref:GDSL-type esterase/lipase family protein n=1 Tax=Luteolibacter arcticus TaxID=1581411 RepID=A0ABT3GQI4_9BACT|nr:GDSL-type esterase/lipase family protein [Luteolibacter arcticus]MCW1925770.1 GDSL-type esterase/lipase family protein [Luteolibacter arcticus]
MKPLLALLFLLPLILRAEAKVLFLGDSITFDGRWTTLVESALRNTAEFKDAEIVNMGLPSETVSGLSEEGHAGGKFPRPGLHERLGRVLPAFKPTLIIACYGMNDGIMLPPDPAREAAYQKGLTRLKVEAEKAGARVIFLTPPLHKVDKPTPDPARYDVTLDRFAEWLVSQNGRGWEAVDIRPGLRASVAAAKAKDPAFVYAGDGIHPGDAGHRFIAEAACTGLWPLLKLPGKPEFAEGQAFRTLKERQDLLKHAWLTATKHQRPGIPTGQPLEPANTQATALLGDYQAFASMKSSSWNGYDRLDFHLAGRASLLIRPKTSAAGQPWIWRTEFFGHEPQGDIALLGKGFHVAYVDLQNLYGAPVALQAMDRFHAFVTLHFSLSKKTVLEGFSRGGLFAFNWAALHPDQTTALYVDAPVCDFKSWPGGKGKGPGSPPDWQRLIKTYNFPDEAAALAWKSNPVDNLAPLAKARIPILAIVGDADEVVPVAENIDLVETRYRKLGGEIQVIRKPGGKHHPHSLPDPKPIVDFVVKAVSP